MFILIVYGKEVLASNKKSIMTHDGEKFLVLNDEPDHWVEATSISYDYSNRFPSNVKLFNTHKKAERFAKQWKGHPWWCKPNGKYEIIEVEPIYRQELIGYKQTPNHT